MSSVVVSQYVILLDDACRHGYQNGSKNARPEITLAKLRIPIQSGNEAAEEGIQELDMQEVSGLRIFLPYLQRTRILLRKSYLVLWQLISKHLESKQLSSQQ